MTEPANPYEPTRRGQTERHARLLPAWLLPPWSVFLLLLVLAIIAIAVNLIGTWPQTQSYVARLPSFERFSLTTADLLEIGIWALLFSLAGSVVVWAGQGKAHWFWRGAALLAVAWLLVPTKAYGTIVFYLLLAAQVIAGLLLARTVCPFFRIGARQAIAGVWHGESVQKLVVSKLRNLATGNLARRWGRPTYSLKEMLLGSSLLGAFCGLLTVLIRNGPFALSQLLASSFAATMLVLALTWATMAAGWIVARMISVLIAVVVASHVWAVAVYFQRYPIGYSSDWDWNWGTNVLFASITSLIISTSLLATRPLFRHNRDRACPPRSLDWLARLFLLAWIAISLPVCGFFYHRLVRPAPLPNAVPDPNGYDLIVKAGDSLPQIEGPDHQTATVEQMRAYVQKCEKPLELMRRAIKVPSRVPVRYEERWFSGQIEAMQVIRRFARILQLEARVRAADGDHAAAARSSTDCMLLGTSARGGLLIHHFLADAAEGIGVSELRAVQSSLDRVECEDVLRRLEAVELQRESVQSVLRQDRLWEEFANLWYGRFHYAMNDLVRTHAADEWILRRTQGGQDRQRALLRLQMTELAIRAYQLEQNTPPDSLHALVPRYLDALPQDPYIQQPLRYKLVDGKVLVYSVGPDGDDDGGQPLDWRGFNEGADGDLFLDIVASG